VLDRPVVGEVIAAAQRQYFQPFMRDDLPAGDEGQDVLAFVLCQQRAALGRGVETPTALIQLVLCKQGLEGVVVDRLGQQEVAVGRLGQAEAMRGALEVSQRRVEEGGALEAVGQSCRPVIGCVRVASWT